MISLSSKAGLDGFSELFLLDVVDLEVALQLTATVSTVFVWR